jgi:hypothetical protein
MSDLSAGAVDFALEGVAVAMPMVQSGLLRALAVTSASRLPALPEVPTVAEAAGLPGYVANGSGGRPARARPHAGAGVGDAARGLRRRGLGLDGARPLR